MSKVLKSVFDGYTSEEPSFQQVSKPLDAHPFRLIAWGFGNSFKTPNGELKAKLPPWSDPTPEIWMHLASLNGEGTIFYHANGLAYKLYRDLTAAEVESGQYEPLSSRKDQSGAPIGQVYACVTNEQGQKVRQIDMGRLDACKRIMHTIVAGFGFPAGTTLDALDVARDEKRTIICDVRREEFDGTVQYRCQNFRNPSKVQAKVPAESWEEGEEV